MPNEWPALFSCPHADAGSFCVQKESRAEKLWQEGFCSLPTELHGSTISQLEEDEKIKYAVTVKLKIAAEEDFENIWLDLFFLGKYAFLQSAYRRHEIGLPCLLLTREKLVRFISPLMQIWREWGGMWHSHWKCPQILRSPLRENIWLL